VSWGGVIVLLALARLLFETLEDLVMARGPEPPGAVGRPTPSLVCSLAFLARVAGGVIGLDPAAAGVSDS
jgi:hypothetical protein